MKKVTDNTLKGYRRGWEEEGECKREKGTKDEERGCHQREQRAKKRENNKDLEGWEFIKAHSSQHNCGIRDHFNNNHYIAIGIAVKF